MNESDSIKIARIEQKVINLDNWRIEHDKKDSDRFEKIFDYIKDGFNNIDQRFDKLNNKVDNVWDYKIANESSSRTWKYVIGGLGTLLAAMLSAGAFLGIGKNQ